MSKRDYVHEMREIIDRETSHGPYVAGAVARAIVEKLQANDPDLLHGWLLIGAEQAIVDAISTRDRSERAHTRAMSGREQFAIATKKFEETGETGPLADWMNLRYVALDGQRRRFGDLRRDDLNYIAEGYEEQARRLRFEAAFMRALAKKVGDGKVSDVFTDAQISELRRSIGL